VIGEAGTAAEAVCRAKELRPDVILLEMQLPDRAGPPVIEALHQAAPQSQILVLTVSDHKHDILCAVKAGARGFLLKDVSSTELVQAIVRIATGEAVLPPVLTTRLVDELSASMSSADPLTEREHDVLVQMSKGLGNKEIAVVLNISQNTVKTHVRRILTKLNLRSRTEAATYALQQGLLPDY
jgi:DNA-binding NarL/FixJ family response regulator